MTLPGAIDDAILDFAKHNLPAFVIGVILALLLIFYLAAKLGEAAQGVDNFVRVVRGWFDSERRDRRRSLAETLAGRLKRLSEHEQWASHGYTDLEVEVIPSVRGRSRISGLLPYRSERRRASLGHEIELGVLTDDMRHWLIAGGDSRTRLFVEGGPKLRDAIDPLLKDVRRENERRARADRREASRL